MAKTKAAVPVSEVEMLRIERDILLRMAADALSDEIGDQVPVGLVAERIRAAAQRHLLADAGAGQTSTPN